MGPSKKLSVCVLLVALLVSISAEQQEITCRDEQGNPVDWFVLYKLPRLHQSPLAEVKLGLAYVFFTSSSPRTGWTLGSFTVNDTRSPPGQTLRPLYAPGNADLLSVLYNDQPPDVPVSFTHGHTKGVVFAGQGQGVWLVHSVPHFPPNPKTSGYGYPATGEHYGQSMLCVTLPTGQMDPVGTQLTYNHPFVYASTLPQNLVSAMPELANAARGAHTSRPPYFRKVDIKSVRGQKFTSFAKTSDFRKDLYADWVSAELQASLMVESWPNGPGRLPPSCNMNFKVVDVLGLNIRVDGESVAEFKDQEDHSKWAIQYPGTTSWTCVGDINRMESQKERAGGTVCLNLMKVWSAFKEAVVSTEKCGAAA
ncbi:deoxyribonuclease-2-alpha [Neocloeon triangulifer]|uniref:deoxyribonuclease-2-alpha n=1 Tax=Neocloeon triangulifer TaxID=2078957 RepID=UPI00286F7961|nr:deoxyribonuclease-2-alpha [Neocloeon triangulifer]